jgi:hypothetical protein
MISIHLRSDPAFKLACGRLPDTDRDLCSQPTLSRLENAPYLHEVIRLSYALVDLWMDSYDRAPSAVTLDIDDTVDVVHDLPLNFHPVAVRVSGFCTPSGAGRATDDRRSWSGLRSRSSVAVRWAA